MENTTLGQIVEACRGRYSGPAAALEEQIPLIVTDSRQVQPGCLFAAFAGANSDGHDFIPQAHAGGALVSLGTRRAPEESAPYIRVPDSERALGDIARWYRRRFTIPMIAVSGSVGKTTCKEMIAAALSSRFRVLKTAGNFNNSLGLPLTLFNLDSSHDVAVLEMGINHFGEMRYLADIARPTAAALTVIGDAHLEALGSRAGVLEAKTEMMDFLPAGAIAYLNGDDPYQAAYQPPPGIIKKTWGLGEDCQVRAEDIQLYAGGLTCSIQGQTLTVNAEGAYLVRSLLPAYAIGRDLGVAPEDLAAGIAAYQPLPGRGNILMGPRCRVIDHSYNANPSSMLAALDSLALFPPRRVALLGDMYELGEDSRALHAKVGTWAAERCQLVIAVGALSQQTYAASLSAGCAASFFPTVEEALPSLEQLIEPGDTVLVKASNALGLSQAAAALAGLE